MAKEEQKKPPKKKTNYLTNKDLLPEVIKCKEKGEMSDRLAEMLQLLTAKYGRSAQFGGYTFNDDMQAYAMMMLCKTWSGFNPERSSNPFAYYTQSIKNSFKQFLNREKVQRVVRDELLVNSGYNPSFTYLAEHSEADHHYVHDEEDHHQVVQDMKELNETAEPDKELVSFDKQ
jgi:DNA-directed RNA polymerase specialized sigma subunit